MKTIDLVGFAILDLLALAHLLNEPHQLRHFNVDEILLPVVAWAGGLSPVVAKDFQLVCHLGLVVGIQRRGHREVSVLLEARDALLNEKPRAHEVTADASVTTLLLKMLKRLLKQVFAELVGDIGLVEDVSQGVAQGHEGLLFRLDGVHCDVNVLHVEQRTMLDVPELQFHLADVAHLAVARAGHEIGCGVVDRKNGTEGLAVRHDDKRPQRVL